MADATDARAEVALYLESLEGETRTVGWAEWGFSVEAAGWPLDVGVAIREGLLRAQASVARPGALEPADLLRWNRQVPFVRFAHTRESEVWIVGELPLSAVTAAELDRFLGLLVLAAVQAREHAAPRP